MCVPVVDPLCIPGKAVESAAGRFLEEIAEQMSEAAAEMLRAMVTGWLSIPTPDVTQESGTVAYLRAYTSWAVAAVAVAAVLVAAGRMAWERDGREAGTFGKGLATMVVLACQRCSCSSPSATATRTGSSTPPPTVTSATAS
ncbi:hypothetical protein [Micromonospora haikouensis]|uniref:hypothetical protein n=1 Tax=Micromonospora haikouensis TaxID=686309 RepID=UPI0037B4CB62